MRLKLVPHVATDTFEESVKLLFTAALKAPLGRAAFSVSGVDKTGTGLTGDKLLTMAEADRIGTGTYQDQGNGKIMLKQGA